MDVKVSKDKHISRWVDQENLIYVKTIMLKLLAILSDTTFRRSEVDQEDLKLY